MDDKALEERIAKLLFIYQGSKDRAREIIALCRESLGLAGTPFGYEEWWLPLYPNHTPGTKFYPNFDASRKAEPGAVSYIWVWLPKHASKRDRLVRKLKDLRDAPRVPYHVWLGIRSLLDEVIEFMEEEE